MKIITHTHTHHKYRPMPTIHLCILIYFHIHCYLRANHSTAQERVCHSIYKIYPGYMSSSNKIFSCSSKSLDIHGGWVAKDMEWQNFHYNRTTNKSQWCANIFLKHNATPLLEEQCSVKRGAIFEGVLFNLMPMDFLCVIVYWLAGLEHSVKFNTRVMQISCPENPVIFFFFSTGLRVPVACPQ